MDIALEEHGDLKIASGDFAVAESTQEHAYQLMANNKGDYKANPTICVGAVNYIDDHGPGNGYGALIDATANELRRDGIVVQKIGLNSEGELEVKGYYK